MARAPDIRVEKAKVLYVQGMKLIEISKALNISEGTILNWKKRYKTNNI